MPISGLMLRLMEGPDGDAAVECLAAWPEVTLGERRGPWLSMALDAPDATLSRLLHERLERLKGIITVDVCSVHFESPNTGANAEVDADVEVDAGEWIDAPRTCGVAPTPGINEPSP